MTNSTFTTNQTSAMHWLIKSCCGNMGGKNLADLQCDPFTWVEASDLENAGWGRKNAEGTFGSLVAAGLVYDADDGLFALTDNWDLLATFHE